ncbi:TetR/AcrR family transcriptional regulator [Nocardia brasiliensis]|uniref:TetR/AcrR family transcriptional regulator n=1 Tax=Nocardia brasiliensis TaxID=37326 RepID=UPI00245542E4|nr:TetR/AcrR family transcriptional regulator [Nocardia brasiliensis]
MVEGELSDELVRLWRLPTGSGLGRRAALDIDQVVGTAVELADHAGLAGATLPKIAERLQVTPMSLYRYIGSKDELLVLMGDMAFGPGVELDDRDSWRGGLRQWATGLWSAYQSHPWLADLPVSSPPRGPHAIAWMDAGLRAMREVELDPLTKVGTLTLLSGYVNFAARMAQQLEQGRQREGVDSALAAQEYGREMAALVTQRRFPDAAELFAVRPFEADAAPSTDNPADPTANFDFGLAVILDGVEAIVQNRSAERVQPS